MVRRHGVGTGANHSGRRCDPVTFLLSTPRLFSDNPSSLTRPTQQALRHTCAAAVLALFPQGKVPPCGAHMAETAFGPHRRLALFPEGKVPP